MDASTIYSRKSKLTNTTLNGYEPGGKKNSEKKEIGKIIIDPYSKIADYSFIYTHSYVYINIADMKRMLRKVTFSV